jgi:hypothetical protein
MKSRLLWVLVFVGCLSAPLLAQDTASITGTVTDQTGAAIPNAQVTVSNPEHGIKRVTVSNGSGDYLVSAIPPGSYNLSITAPGFKRYEATGVILRVAEKARADAALQVGAAKEEVLVEGTGRNHHQQRDQPTPTQWPRFYSVDHAHPRHYQSDRFLRRAIRHHREREL